MGKDTEYGYALLTVGELRDQLSEWRDTDKVFFGSTLGGNPLVFYRFKRRGDDMLQIELSEVQDAGPL